MNIPKPKSHEANLLGANALAACKLAHSPSVTAYSPLTEWQLELSSRAVLRHMGAPGLIFREAFLLFCGPGAAYYGLRKNTNIRYSSSDFLFVSVFERIIFLRNRFIAMSKNKFQKNKKKFVRKVVNTILFVN